ncbi:MAG: exonuclease domain-containing protein [Candidatus Limivivens sp.]|nr:exonuclease domain-containing protein [Candidatus Limivivens sp.]
MKTAYIAVDLETTGLDPKEDQILEIGAVRMENGRATEIYEVFVNSGVPIPEKIQALTGITPEMAASGLPVREAMEGFLEFCGDWDILGHNILFDYSFLKCSACRLGKEFEKSGIDTLRIARKFMPDLPSRRLDALCAYFSIAQEKKHRASYDAIAAARLYQELGRRYEELEPEAFLSRPLIYKVKKEAPITISQKLYLLDLAKYHRIDLDVSVDSLTKSQASKMIDRIILNYGRIKR